MIIPFIEHINFYEWLKFRFLNGESIPNEYLPIPYLQSTGTQYIDTGLTFYNIQGYPYKYEVECIFDDANYKQLFGMYYNYDHGFATLSNGNIGCKCARYDTLTDSGISRLNKVKCIADYANKKVSIINGETTFNHTYNTFTPTPANQYKVLLFATYTSWYDRFDEFCKGKIYSFKYWENGELLRDMIPVIRLSDYKPGMYDKVTQTFFTNQGTGEFENPVYGYLSGNPPFTFDSNGNPLVSWTIKGNTIQSGTPTPENPITPEGCGDLETVGDKAGQYKIPISSANTTTPIYLGEVETTRRIKKLVLTGQENLVYEAAYTRFKLTLTDMMFLGIRTTPILCSHYITIDDGRALSDIPNNAIYVGGAVGTVQFAIKTDEYNTESGFKGYLAQQYAAGTPVTVWYVLAEPETAVVNEPLMKIGDYADTLTNTVEIPTTSGSNTLTVDTTVQPSEVDIIYEK